MAGQQSNFDTLLGKLSSLIGDDAPEMARNAFAMGSAVANPWGTAATVMGNALARGVHNEMSGVEPQNRGSQMPIANWPDGPGLAIPQSLIDAKEAFGRFHRGEAPQPQDAVLAGLAMTGGGFGSLAARGARAVSGRALEGVEAPWLNRRLGEWRDSRMARAMEKRPEDAPTYRPRDLPSMFDTGFEWTGPKYGRYTVSPEWMDNAVGGAARSADDLAPTAANDANIGTVRLNANPKEGWLAGWLPWGRENSVRPPAQVDPPVALPSHSVEAGSTPVTARVYRGTGYPESETGHPGPYFASDSPAVAATYAEGQAPAVYPSDVTFRNPMVLDAAGGTYNDLPGFGGNMYAAVEAARKAGNDGLVLRNIRDPMRGEGGPVATTYAAISPGTVRSSTTGETLFSNPKEAAPAGVLATSGLDRMRVEDTAKPRSIPDAPMSLDDLQSYVDQNFENGSGNRVIAARAENPQRYWDYANGLHDVLNPQSDWISSGPTLQSGGVSGAAVGTAGSSEHHSRSQPRGEGGRFVAKDSFDGRLAALDKMMVDLDGDGTPDVAMPANALMRVGQGSAPNYLNKRGYQDQLPPAQSNFEHWTDEMLAEWGALVSKKAAELEKQGLPKSEAMMRAQDEPDMKAARARILQRAPKDISPEMRRLLDQ